MRIAVIGAGRIGAMHAAGLAAQERVEELLIADVDGDRAVALAQQVGARALPDCEAVWESRADAVVVATATPTHAGFVHAALDARLPVFCEKPLTLSLRESAEIAARERAGVTPVMVGFQRRFDAAFQTLKNDLAAGRYGTPYTVSVRHGDTGAPPPGYLARSGSMFLDMCIHDFDSIRWLTGCEVESVTALGARRTNDAEEFERHGDVDTAVALMRLADGPLASVEVCRHSALGYLVEAEVLASDGRGSLPVDAAAEIGERTFLRRFEPAFRAEMEAFVSLIEEGGENLSDAEQATATLRVALAAERSFREDRTVRVEEVIA